MSVVLELEGITLLTVLWAAGQASKEKKQARQTKVRPGKQMRQAEVRSGKIPTSLSAWMLYDVMVMRWSGAWVQVFKVNAVEEKAGWQWQE